MSQPRQAGAVVAGLVVTLLGVGSLAVQTSRAAGTIATQRSAKVAGDARIDDAYYACLDRQARSLIGPQTPVAYRPGASLGEAVVLNKAVASWITLSPPGQQPTRWLGIRHTGGVESCLGDVVTLRTRGADGTWTVRLGHGARVPGQGPPPAPPL